MKTFIKDFSAVVLKVFTILSILTTAGYLIWYPIAKYIIIFDTINIPTIIEWFSCGLSLSLGVSMIAGLFVVAS